MRITANFVSRLLYLTIPLSATTADSFDNAVQKVMTDNHIRGAAITLFDKSTMMAPVARGYGRIDAASTSPVVTADTTFMLASVSKVFTASAVAMLVDQGKITLDDDICNVIPNTWTNKARACRNPNYPTTKVTWRMLATHRSSLKSNLPDARNAQGNWISPSYGPSGGYISSAPAAGNPTCPLRDVQTFYRDLLTGGVTSSVAQGLTLLGGTTLNWYTLMNNRGGAWNTYAPGAKSVYSNLAAGYEAALVELASGQDFAEFSKQYLFAPLNMTRTAWFSSDLPSNTRQAVPVKYRSASNSWKSIGDYCYADYASGELRTTANDLSRWGDAMLQYGSTTLWSNATAKQVFSCQERNANNQLVDNCRWNLGWIRLNNDMKSKASLEAWLEAFSKYDWTDGVMHDGAEAGVQTQIIILPCAGVYVMVLTNTDGNGGWAAQKLAKAVISAPRPTTTGTPTAPSSPVAAPTPTAPAPTAPAPTATACTDASDGVFWVNSNNGYRQCSWLKARPTWISNLCDKKGDASYYCQATCQSCSYWSGNNYRPEIKLEGPAPASAQCYNAAGVFWVYGLGEYHNCDWLASKPTWKQETCGWDVPGDYMCQKLCGSCPDW